MRTGLSPGGVQPVPVLLYGVGAGRALLWSLRIATMRVVVAEKAAAIRKCLHNWCWPWSSKPAGGLNKALSGFDSHTLPLLEGNFTTAASVREASRATARGSGFPHRGVSWGS